MAAKHFLGLIALALAVAPAALADPFNVKVDQTVAVKLTSPANSVVVGNATVADVAVHDAMTLLITGKSFGNTNVLVLDRSGRTIWSNELAVSGGASNELTILRNGANYTYSCTDKCRGAPAAGDDPTFFAGVQQTVTGKEATAKGNGGN